MFVTVHGCKHSCCVHVVQHVFCAVVSVVHCILSALGVKVGVAQAAIEMHKNVKKRNGKN